MSVDHRPPKRRECIFNYFIIHAYDHWSISFLFEVWRSTNKILSMFLQMSLFLFRSHMEAGTLPKNLILNSWDIAVMMKMTASDATCPQCKNQFLVVLDPKTYFFYQAFTVRLNFRFVFHTTSGYSILPKCNTWGAICTNI